MGGFTLSQKILTQKAMNALFKIGKQINFSRLPFRKSQKIIDAVILPIITYGCKVWGIYNKFDFDK